LSAHPATELLSAYLDRELADEARRAVEAHVEDCGGCRHRLEGLRRVVDHLHSVPTVRPPITMARGVESRISRAVRERQPLLRREGGVANWNLVHPAVGLGFALVVAFALILLLFSQGLSQSGSVGGGSVSSEGVSELPEGQRLKVGDRAFRLRNGVWWQEGVNPERSPVLLTADESAKLAAGNRWLRDVLRFGWPVVFEAEDGGLVKVLAVAGEALSPDPAPR
jgi:hypothetical protein